MTSERPSNPITDPLDHLGDQQGKAIVTPKPEPRFTVAWHIIPPAITDRLTGESLCLDRAAALLNNYCPMPPMDPMDRPTCGVCGKERIFENFDCPAHARRRMGQGLAVSREVQR